ncbi:redoxin family protein [Clostridium sp. NSJ-49]|uniref:cytochrome c biogenesis protein/redoxin n=1 Tax=Clostridium sp. NSJ-49 TaxID=2763034 RepID=UPI00164CD180|nr:cytochrome c biogenesis protein/redoxin [Clostridium sp. NSJ-49]MBC5625265.1 redoxin family protein [Clostridium sp. NSJ-49]
MGNINIFIVFIEGILSIFSPCILPILPIYLSMLANSTVSDMNDSKFKGSVLIRNTIFFTLGISATFFILGASINALGAFFNTYKYLIMIIGGVIIIIMGLFYLGIIKSEFLSREKRLSVKYKTMSPVSAFVLGFTFSFGWTPCIGPILASVLVMASTADNIVISNLLILVYTLGFILPFLIVAIFYSKLGKRLNKIKNHMDTIKKISGIFILIAGLIMLVNGFVDVNKQLNTKNENTVENNNSSESSSSSQNSSSSSEENAEEEDNRLAPIDFTLYDNYGNQHTLSEYKGKTVFLNFWATWCPPCREEMPYIEELYKEYNENKDDVIILGVASPNLGREGTEEHITEFLKDNEMTFPVVFDEKGSLMQGYGMNAFPSTLIIDKEGYITRYIPGAMNKETMKMLIEEER